MDATFKIISYTKGRILVAHIQNGIRFHILKYDLSLDSFIDESVDFKKSKI